MEEGEGMVEDVNGRVLERVRMIGRGIGGEWRKDEVGGCRMSQGER